MSSYTVIKEAIDSQMGAFTEFKKVHLERVDQLQNRLEDLEVQASNPKKTGGPTDGPEAKAFEKFLRKGDMSELEHKDMSEGTTAAGGAMVPKQIADQIINRALAQSALGSLVRVTEARTSDYHRILNLRGAVASWVAESGARTATAEPTLRDIVTLHGELYSYPTVTNWLMQDSQFNVSDFIVSNVADQFAKSIEAAILNGTGTNQPKGILTDAPTAVADDPPTRAQDVIQFFQGTAALADNLIDLFFTLKPEYRKNAKWLMNSLTLATVRKVKDTVTGTYLWQPTLGAGVDAGDGTLLGKPVFTSENMPANTTTLNSIMVGDFVQGYELVRIGGLMITRDEITVPGKTRFYVRQRFGGRLVDNDALKVRKQV